MSVKALIGVVVLVHLVFAAVYALVTPYRTPGYFEGVYLRDIGNPDEMAHGKYIQYIAEGKGLPSAKVAENMPTYEAHQPPLYYAAAAAWSKVGGCSDFEARRTGIWLRLLSVLFGGLTVAGTCAAAWWGYGRKDLTFGAGLIVGLLPMNIALSAAINNDALLIALGTWTLALCIKAYRQGWNLKLALSVGVLTGLGLLTKSLAACFLFPIAASYLASRRNLKYPAGAALLGLAIASPLWIRNALLYGDPLMLKTFEQLSKADAMPPMHSLHEVLRTFTVFVQSTSTSFYGIMGYMNIRLPIEVYAILIVCTGWLLVRCLRQQKANADAAERGVNWIVGSLLLGALLLYIRFNISHTQPQARYFFPAVAPIGLFLAKGAFGISAKGMRAKAAVILAAMLSLSVLSVFAIKNGYSQQINDLADAGGPSAFETQAAKP